MRYIENINEEPNATKKGLRMKIQGIELDGEGYITHIYIDYSLLKEIGGGILQLADFNRMKFEVDNG